ncbi:aspartate dehydrogenase [Bhargavaea beijingensis]|uniref:L-aspartate dehydrogenase n=1 Tax=Bhargavaea beijingensis TaxID=426756 RepID=A0A1G7EXD2_9BACL|nr:aspartate dehydrogenase [Bhargavaea beijingensis]SDE68086.1 aspartate dehydrogenase [Bhargavaea beijingensis]
MNIGVLGTGNIATYLLECVNEEKLVDGEIKAVCGRNREAGKQLAARYSTRFYEDVDEFIASGIDVVIEAAAIEVAAARAVEVLKNGKDFIATSIGAFKDAGFLEDVRKTAQANGRSVFLPSGAIGGLDLLQSANAIGGLQKVSITTRKSPRSLGLDSMDEEKLLFEGSAGEAIGKFPENINVALLLSLAGLGTDKTRVRIIADPAVERNTHLIEADGSFGKMMLKTENTPMPGNPKTSYLAALSILSVLQNKGNPVIIG